MRRLAIVAKMPRAGSAVIPFGRSGEAEEFADPALFLASDVGSYVTGTTINVDGGMSPVVCVGMG